MSTTYKKAAPAEAEATNQSNNTLTNNVSIVEYMSTPVVEQNIQKTLRDRAPQFVASVAALVNSNPKLAACERKSVLSACLIAASLDLPINQNLGFAYIIPYKVSVKTTDESGREVTQYVDQAQFQMGAKGFKQLAIRTGKYLNINDEDVREGEYLGKNRMTGEHVFNWEQDDSVRTKLPIVGYLAYLKLSSGYEKSLYMTVDELRQHGLRYSKSYKTGQWTNDFDSMARKTVIKLLISKHGLMTSRMEMAVAHDQAVVTDGRSKYVDNQPTDPAEVAAEKERERIVKHIENSKTLDELELCLEAVADQDDQVQQLYSAKQKSLSGAK